MIYDEADVKRCLTTAKWLIGEHRTELASLIADREETLQVLSLEEDPYGLI